MSAILLLCLLVLSVEMTPGGAQDGMNAPFCKLCSCQDGGRGVPDVYCARNIKDYLFDTSYWYDNSKNASYVYGKLSVQFSSLLTLDKQFPVSSILVLDLANNSLVNISDNIFSNLQNMEELILSDNKIELLHPDAFKGLYLEGDFLPLKSLKKLRLDNNRIHSLNDDLFEHTSRIELLDLSHNPLTVIDQQTQIAITSLVYLKVEIEEILPIAMGLMTGLPKNFYKELDLSYTQISTLPDNFMHTPRYITRLDLSGNFFTGIPETLGDSHNLLELIMDRNPIVNLTAQNGFPIIGPLRILHMCHMDELRNISKHALSGLRNLTELYITDNIKLVHLHQEALSDRVDDAEYETWPPIKKLHLEDNKLAYIDMLLLGKWDGLTELDLTNNAWTCECENQWMVDELVPIYLAIDEVKAKTLRCAAPIEMAEFTFYDVYEKKSTMRCLDIYGHRPERDGTLLVGLLAGILIAIPLILFIIYSYQRNWFGIFDKSPASYSRQFYKRTQSSDEYF